MKKLISITLLLTLLLGVFSGCKNIPAETSSVPNEASSTPNEASSVPTEPTLKWEEIDLNDYYYGEFYTEEEAKMLIEKCKTTFGDYHNEPYAEYYRRPYQDRVGYDYGGILPRAISKEKANELSDIVRKKYENMNFQQLMEARLVDEPILYQVIRIGNVSKEDFIKGNEAYKETGLLEQKDGYHTEPSIFTSEEIELLYSDDIEAIREYFVGPYAFYANKKVYTVEFLFNTTPERWKQENIPIDKLKALIEMLIEEEKKDIVRYGFSKWRQQNVLHTLSLVERLEEYEKLIKTE